MPIKDFEQYIRQGELSKRDKAAAWQTAELLGEEAFANNSWYFRNALVRANYADIQKGIHSTYEPWERFMRFLLSGEKPDLRNRTLHIHAGEMAESKVQNKPVNSLGLQELAVVKAIEANDAVTLDQFAAVLGKSRSTVKRIVDALKGKGMLDREGTRKTGRWVLKMGNNYRRF